MRKIIIQTILSALSLFLTCVAVAQEKRALVIGVGEYPETSGWSKINGDRDIDIITTFLLDNGFAHDKIITLKNAQATKANIIQQFKSITALVKPGDHIYVHFSGHGQQVTDINGDEDDRYDEAWVPYDAQKFFVKGKYEGENHLVDDQVNELLRNIRKKIGLVGKLTVVADACYSGDSSRGDDHDDDLIARGTLDCLEIPIEQPVRRTTKLPIQWVMISACQSYQPNYEYKIGNVHYGSLSYSLYLLRKDVTGKSVDTVNNMISETLSGLVTRIQTIQIDTNDDSSKAILFSK